ncbi:MAG: CopG family transcriptional regulator [Ignavibacteria bacterium]|nr:CopG family transcriptional regulator [Ignavibacteria bacterium]
MITSIRIPKDLEKRIKKYSESKKLNKTEIIKKALYDFFEDYEEKNSVFESGKEYFGNYGSGRKNQSTEYKSILKKKIASKRSN